MTFCIQAGKIKNEIILHIGPPKTGTSTLQDTLVTNKKMLEQFNIRIPELTTSQLNIFGKKICDRPECLALEAILANSQKIIISAESLTQAIHNGDFFNLTNSLKLNNLVSDIHVIYAKRSFNEIAISEAIQNCYRSAKLNVNDPFREHTANKLQRFICTAQIWRRKQLPILNALMENNLRITILDIQGKKDINQLFFSDFLKLNEISSSIIMTERKNITSNRAKDEIVMKFIREVLANTNTTSENEIKRKNLAEHFVSRQDATSSELFKVLISKDIQHEIEIEEREFEQTIKASDNQLTIL